jgi:DNA-directed RNA polymerase subunit RPC12/RpoP
MSDNGHRALTPEERQHLRDLVEFETRERAGLPIPDALLERIRWDRHVEESRARRAEENLRRERRFRERRLALRRGYLCEGCGAIVSVSAGDKARGEGRPIRCRECANRIEAKRRRLDRRCSFCGAGITNGGYLKAVKDGRPPSCSACRYARARIDPPPCADCGQPVSKNHAYQVRKKGKTPRCQALPKRVQRRYSVASYREAPATMERPGARSHKEATSWPKATLAAACLHSRRSQSRRWRE